MIEPTVINNIPGTVAYFDAEGVPCSREKAVSGEVTLETGDRIIVTFEPPANPFT